MVPVTPFWFKQRQAKVEDAGPDLVRVSGPNLKEGYLGIRRLEGGLWSAYVRESAEGPDVEATAGEIKSAYYAWEAAFEIYRERMVV